MNTRIIAVANQKGGVGKTTTAVSMAACLGENHYSTLLVDLDPQGNATSALGQEKLTGGSVYNTLMGGTSLLEAIRPTGYPNLDLVPSELDLAAAELHVAKLENYLLRLRQTLHPIRESGRYRVVLVDCPPSLGILTMNALAAADSVLIPLQCEYFALEGLTVITGMVQKLRDAGANPSLVIEGIVMTMYDGRTNLSQQVVSDVRSHYGAAVFETVVPRTVRLGEAPSFGKPITVYDSGSLGALAYRQLSDELICRIEARMTAESPTPAVPQSTVISHTSDTTGTMPG